MTARDSSNRVSRDATRERKKLIRAYGAEIVE
jgi:hypothetical protein